MGNSLGYASIDDMASWAEDLIASRLPDFVIGDSYLLRWWVIPRNQLYNLYLHDIRKSDDDRAMHDHPWENTSLLISGGYIEHTPQGVFERKCGDIVHRKPTDLHRLEVIPGQRAISLFATELKVKDWGFQCPKEWVSWQDFTSPNDSSKTGRGCGEMS